MKITVSRCTPTQYLLLFVASLLTLLLWRITNLIQRSPTGLLYRVVLIGDIRDDNNNPHAFSRLVKKWQTLGVNRVIQPGFDSPDNQRNHMPFLWDLIHSFAVPWPHSIAPYTVSPVPGFVFAFLHSREGSNTLKMGEVAENERKSRMKKNTVVGESQLAWLNRTITKAREKDEKVIVISHVPIHPGAVTDQSSLARDYNRVLGVIMGEGSGVVVAAFSGREPDGALHYMEKHILFLTLGTTSATDAETMAYAICDLFSDRLQIQGFVKVPSLVVPFRRISN